MVELLSSIWVSHLNLVLLNDLAHLVHDHREDTNTNHHAYNCDDHLQLTYWIEVSISDRRKHGQGKIQTRHKLNIYLFAIEIIDVVPRIFLTFLELFGDDKPDAAEKECAK